MECPTISRLQWTTGPLLSKLPKQKGDTETTLTCSKQRVNRIETSNGQGLWNWRLLKLGNTQICSSIEKTECVPGSKNVNLEVYKCMNRENIVYDWMLYWKRYHNQIYPNTSHCTLIDPETVHLHIYQPCCVLLLVPCIWRSIAQPNDTPFLGHKSAADSGRPNLNQRDEQRLNLGGKVEKLSGTKNDSSLRIIGPPPKKSCPCIVRCSDLETVNLEIPWFLGWHLLYHELQPKLWNTSQMNL